jgi:hypothetical protein
MVADATTILSWADHSCQRDRATRNGEKCHYVSFMMSQPINLSASRCRGGTFAQSDGARRRRFAAVHRYFRVGKSRFAKKQIFAGTDSNDRKIDPFRMFRDESFIRHSVT